MLSFLGSIMNYINTNQKSDDIIKQAKINRKLSQEVFQPVQEKFQWFNDKNMNKRNMKINQRSFENRIKKIVSNYFQTEFIKVRPNWLKNHLTGKNLELDIYSHKLKISIEFQGCQHTQFVPFFHKSQKDFENQIIRDHIKQRLCNENGIKLICIHHYDIPNSNDILDCEILDIILEKMSKVI